MTVDWAHEFDGALGAARLPLRYNRPPSCSIFFDFSTFWEEIFGSFEDFWDMKIFLGLIFGLDGEVVRKTFIERKCATVAPSDRIDCGYEGKNKAFSENFQ